MSNTYTALTALTAEINRQKTAAASKIAELQTTAEADRAAIAELHAQYREATAEQAQEILAAITIKEEEIKTCEKLIDTIRKERIYASPAFLAALADVKTELAQLTESCCDTVDTERAAVKTAVQAINTNVTGGMQNAEEYERYIIELLNDCRAVNGLDPVYRANYGAFNMISIDEQNLNDYFEIDWSEVGKITGNWSVMSGLKDDMQSVNYHTKDF